MKKQKNKPERLYEYRIKYNAGDFHSEHDSYHYYNAYNAPQALGFHLDMLKKKCLTAQTLQIEKKNPFSDAWEDESSILESLFLFFPVLIFEIESLMPIRAKALPIPTVDCSEASISNKFPSSSAGTSTTILSVSSSSRTSPLLKESPGDLNQVSTVPSSIVSPILGSEKIFSFIFEVRVLP